MNENIRYEINKKNAAYDVLDGEVIIINLDNGFYYSIDTVGVEIWTMIQKAYSIGGMIETLAAQYEGERSFIAHSLGQMLNELESEGLVTPMAGHLTMASEAWANQPYRVNEPHILSDMLKDEIVLINQQNDQYYSIQGTGVDIWEMLSCGHLVPRIIERLSQKYENSGNTIESSVWKLVEQLVAEGLIVPGAITAKDTEAESLSPSPVSPTVLQPFSPPRFNQYADLDLVVNSPNEMPKKPFRAPAIEKYTDMEDLLLLDPIHDVGQEGWPQRHQEA